MVRPEGRANAEPQVPREELNDYLAAMARRKSPPIGTEDRAAIGRVLRDLRRAAGFRSVEAAVRTDASPAARQTIYAYERGGLTPSLTQFLELVEFYVLDARGDDPKAEEDLRAQGVAAVTRALTLKAYHVAEAWELMARMQPVLSSGRGRKR